MKEVYNVIYPYFADDDDYIIYLILDYANIIFETKSEAQLDRLLSEHIVYDGDDPKDPELKPEKLLPWKRFFYHWCLTAIWLFIVLNVIIAN